MELGRQWETMQQPSEPGWSAIVAMFASNKVMAAAQAAAAVPNHSAVWSWRVWKCSSSSSSSSRCCRPISITNNSRSCVQLHKFLVACCILDYACAGQAAMPL